MHRRRLAAASAPVVADSINSFYSNEVKDKWDNPMKKKGAFLRFSHHERRALYAPINVMISKAKGGIEIF